MEPQTLPRGRVRAALSWKHWRLCAERSRCDLAARRSTGRRRTRLLRDLGVRPFINASGTYTAMTASLMPPEVMDAIDYASRHYVMLEELQLRLASGSRRWFTPRQPW